MEKSVKILLLILLLLMVVGLIYAIKANPSKEVMLRGFTDVVYKNPWKVAEVFLSAHDITVKSHRGLQKLYELPTGNNSLLVSSSRKVMAKERLDALIKWVEQGGHLITTAQDFFDDEKEKSNDVLLNQLNVKKYRHVENPHIQENPKKPSPEEFEEMDVLEIESIEKIESSDDKTEYNDINNNTESDGFHTDENPLDEKDITDKNDDANEDRKLSESFDPLRRCNEYHNEHMASFYMSGDDNEYKVHFPGHHFLQDGGENAVVNIASVIGPQFLQFEQGEGMITIITNMQLWNNFNIGCIDHAYLLYKLVEHSDRVDILYTDDVPGILTLLWLKAKVVIIAISVLLLLLLWHRNQRLGPVLSIPSLHRRQLLEHIQAAGLYLWKYKSHGILLRDLRQDIISKMQSRQRNFNVLSSHEQYQLIAHVCGYSTEKVKRIMTEEVASNYQVFTQIVKALQTIRKQL